MSTMFTCLHAPDELARVLEHSAAEPVVVFKHSRLCGSSAAARRRLEALSEPGDPPVYEVVVQGARPLAQHIADTLGIRHESPQVIVLHERQAIYHASHSRVQPEAIRAAITATAPDTR